MSEADDKILKHLNVFSARARQVVFAARLKAGQRGGGMIDVGDLLLGMVLEDQGMMGNLLSNAQEGLGPTTALPLPSHSPFFPTGTASELMTRIEELLPKSEPIGHTVEVPLSPELQYAFDGAKDLQNMFRHEQIGPLHLLAAVLADESSQYTKLLQNVGITKAQVLKKLKGIKLDDNEKRISLELARAINEALAESKRVVEVVSEARAAGFEIALRLDGTIRLTRLSFQENTVQGRHILESLHLSLDFDESAES